MYDSIRRVHLSIEKLGLEDIDYSDEHTDVIIELANGDNYVASFYTYRNLTTLRNQHKESGLFLGGKYFWTERLIIIEDLSRRAILEVVNDLFEEGNFYLAFKKLS